MLSVLSVKAPPPLYCLYLKAEILRNPGNIIQKSNGSLAAVTNPNSSKTCYMQRLNQASSMQRLNQASSNHFMFMILHIWTCRRVFYDYELCYGKRRLINLCNHHIIMNPEKSIQSNKQLDLDVEILDGHDYKSVTLKSCFDVHLGA